MQSLDAGYNPQRQSINDQISKLPSQAAAQTAGLQGQQQTAFDGITNQARDRGMGFSGIPLQEQAKYTADSYLPAVARVQQSQNEAHTSLSDALNGINLQQRTQAYGMQNDQLNREQQQAQFETEQAASLARTRAAAGGGGSGDLAGLFGGGDALAGVDPTAGAAPTASPMASFKQRSDKGYQFTDHNGRAINAAQYSRMTNVPIRTLLSQMAASGDVGARTALGFIGGDGRADPRKITNPAIANLYKAITGQNIGVYKAPVKGDRTVATAKNFASNVKNSFAKPGGGNSKVQQQLAAARASGRVK